MQKAPVKELHMSFNDTVKHIFDHLRNLGICGAVFFGGRYLTAHAAELEFLGSFFRGGGGSPNDLGYLVSGIGILLLGLCVVQFFITADQWIPSWRNAHGHRSAWPIMLILFFIYLPLLAGLVLVAAIKA
jgi:hypothetical protein